VKNAIDVVGGGRLRRAVHGLLIVVTRSVNGREFRHLTVICMPPPGDCMAQVINELRGAYRGGVPVMWMSSQVWPSRSS
jgi:hypothetical protein